MSYLVFSVFISHSMSDRKLVDELAKWLNANGINAHVAEWYIQAGEALPTKIAQLIDQSDCVLAIMTTDGERSTWVNQEIGYAKKAQKLIVPLVEEGTPVTGFVSGLEYIPFRRYDPYDAINRVVYYLKSLEARREQEDRGRAITAGLMVFFGLLGLATAAAKTSEQ